MAKTNLYSSRDLSALAFDEEGAAEGYGRAPGEAARRPRTRASSSSGGASSSSPRTEGTRALRFEDFDEAEDEPRGGRLAGGPGRGGRRKPVQQGRSGSRIAAFLLRTRVGLGLLALGVILCGAVLVLGYRAFRGFLESDPHFRIASSSSIQIAGAAEVSRADLLAVFGSDLGRNIFFVPLAQRRAALEQLPWVRHAAVMRLLPDQLRVSVTERTPVAFVRLGSTVELIDRDGVILHLQPATLAERHYSFPVVTGLRAEDAPEARAARMQLYERFVAEIDGGGQLISPEISEVNLADVEDVLVTVPAKGSDLQLHLGDNNFLPRYRSYQAHLEEWRQQYPHLSAIDLRYDRQVVLKMADGAESEASSVDTGRSLVAAPSAAAAPSSSRPTGHAGAEQAGLAVHHTSGGAAAMAAAGAHRHPAGHGAVHTKDWGWRPR